MNAIFKPLRWSLAEYLAREEAAAVRHELVDGQLYAMAGESATHNSIVMNLVAALLGRARSRGCEVYAENLQLRIARATDQVDVYYPDLMICCDPADSDPRFRSNPCVIVEVLSPSTRVADLRQKRLAYQQVPGLAVYLALEQGGQAATLFRRATGWAAEAVLDPELELDLECHGLKLLLAEAYAGLELGRVALP